MGILKLISRGITKIVSWGLRKAGEGIIKIAAKVASYGIDVTTPAVINDMRTSIIETDKYGTYGDIKDSLPVPTDRMVESTDSMRRRYRTLYEVTLVNPYTSEKIIKYSSIYHDYNIPNRDLKKKLETMLFSSNESSFNLNYYVESMDRKLVWHRSGDEY